MCKMFIKECPWYQDVCKGEEGSKIGQREPMSFNEGQMTASVYSSGSSEARVHLQHCPRQAEIAWPLYHACVSHWMGASPVRGMYFCQGALCSCGNPGGLTAGGCVLTACPAAAATSPLLRGIWMAQHNDRISTAIVSMYYTVWVFALSISYFKAERQRRRESGRERRKKERMRILVE